MSPVQKFRSLSTAAKAAVGLVGGLVTIGSFVGMVIAADKYVVDQQELVQTIEQLDTKLSQEIEANSQRDLMRLYDQIDERYWRLKGMLKADPNNIELQEEYESVAKKRSRMRVELGLVE